MMTSGLVENSFCDFIAEVTKYRRIHRNALSKSYVEIYLLKIVHVNIRKFSLYFFPYLLHQIYAYQIFQIYTKTCKYVELQP